MSRRFSQHRGLSGRYCRFWPGLPSWPSFDLARAKFRFTSLPSWPSFDFSQPSWPSSDFRQPSLPSFDFGRPSLPSSKYSLPSGQVASFYHLVFAKFWAEARVRINPDTWWIFWNLTSRAYCSENFRSIRGVWAEPSDQERPIYKKHAFNCRNDNPGSWKKQKSAMSVFVFQ